MTNKEYISIVNKIMKYLMGYNEDMKLTKFMILRLQGLTTGKSVANHYIKDQAHYDYETIINTFKYFKGEIDNALNSMQFKDDMHKFNTILCIIEKHLNDTVKIMNKKKENDMKIQNINTDILTHSQAEYQQKSTNNDESTNNKLKNEMEELW